MTLSARHPRRRRHRAGRGRARVRPRQHAARRLAEPLADTDALARRVAIRRHRRHHGGALFPETLIGPAQQDLHSHRRRRRNRPRRRRAAAQIRCARRRLWRGRRTQLRPRRSPACKPGGRTRPAASTRRWRACRTISSTSAPISACRRSPATSGRAARRRRRRRVRWSARSTISTPSWRRSIPSCCRAARRPRRRCISARASAGAPSGRSSFWPASETVGAPALAYVNRLSDYLFVAARFANGRGASDVLWVPGAHREA